MVKKLLAVLLVIVMIISIAPAAFATCEHEWLPGYQPYGDGCAIVCVLCGDAQNGSEIPHSDPFGTGKCFWCGTSLTDSEEPVEPTEPECKHEWKGVVNNDEASHKIICRDCKEDLGTESHNFVNGICACGAIYVEPA